ncbi:Glucosylceramidase [Aphelenchoides besseyi]|nr:Glucosylceramidase [Aphelenchoides besseyi]
MWLTYSLVIFLSVSYGLSIKQCQKKVVDAGLHKEVCVCTSNYCDEVPSLGNLDRNQVAIYSTSKAGKRFNRTDSYLWTTPPEHVDHEITINYKKKYQKIIGFGAAFTDSAGINLRNLSNDLQETLIAQYYGVNGIELTNGRVPMASTDFSTHAYTYCDVEDDFELKNFALADEDINLKIPFIKMAEKIRGQPLNLFATPWSPPAWMKQSGKIVSGGPLKGDIEGAYYKTWAQYYIRFFEEYAKKDIKFWGVAVQNEPSLGIVEDFWWQELYLSPATEREFIKQHLGPALRGNKLTKNLKIMCTDDQRFQLPGRPDEILNDTVAASFVDGISIHWYYSNIEIKYEDFLFSTDRLDEVHNRHPNHFILGTEACNGYTFVERGVNLGSWEGGEAYATDIIDDLKHWVAGWTDWNLCLSEEGGPTFVNNVVDASIIVNAKKNEFYKQPTFFALGHFSKFIRPDSVRVDMQISNLSKKDMVEGVAFLRPDNQFVVVIQNRNEEKEFTFRLKDPVRPLNSIQLTLEPNSIYSLIWKM